MCCSHKDSSIICTRSLSGKCPIRCRFCSCINIHICAHIITHRHRQRYRHTHACASCTHTRRQTQTHAHTRTSIRTSTRICGVHLRTPHMHPLAYKHTLLYLSLRNLKALRKEAVALIALSSKTHANTNKTHAHAHAHANTKKKHAYAHAHAHAPSGSYTCNIMSFNLHYYVV